MTELRQLAQFIYDLEWEDVPDDAKSFLKTYVIDTIGVAIAAKDHELVRSMIKRFQVYDNDRSSASIWGQNLKMSIFNAVYFNAMQSHMLEMDDAHTASKCHVGAVVIPVSWSLADFLRKSGKEFLTAALCGYEALTRMGIALGVSGHRNRGWHATGTAGVIGSVAAAGKLLGLSVDQLVYAMGMATQITGGTWAFLEDGAASKVLNPMNAAVNGLKCAINAQAGMTGPEHVMTSSDGGVLAMMSDAYDVSALSADLGTVWQVTRMDNKLYPCCRSTHCAIDAALELREKHGVSAIDIDHINIGTYLVGNKQCGMSKGSIHPATPMEARFSTPFAVVSALLDGQVSLKNFTQEMIDRKEIQELLPRIRVYTDEMLTGLYPEHWGCRLNAFLKNGRELEIRIDDAAGSSYHPLTDAQLEHKITGLLREVMEEADVKEMINYLKHIEKQEVITSL